MLSVISSTWIYIGTSLSNAKKWESVSGYIRKWTTKVSFIFLHSTPWPPVQFRSVITGGLLFINSSSWNILGQRRLSSCCPFESVSVGQRSRNIPIIQVSSHFFLLVATLLFLLIPHRCEWYYFAVLSLRNVRHRDQVVLAQSIGWWMKVGRVPFYLLLYLSK